MKPLTCFGIILILAVLSYLLLLFLLSAIQAAHEAGRRMGCQEHQKMILTAINAYYAEHGSMPPLYTSDKDGKPLHSWRVLLLPYFQVESTEKYPHISPLQLYQKIKLDEPWDSEHNKQYHEKCPYCYYCPNNPRTYPNDEDCYYSLMTFGKYQGIIDVREPVNWMNPTADITFEELMKNAEAMKDVIDEIPPKADSDKRIYQRHRRGKIVPVVNIGFTDGKNIIVRDVLEQDLTEKTLKNINSAK